MAALYPQEKETMRLYEDTAFCLSSGGNLSPPRPFAEVLSLSAVVLAVLCLHTAREISLGLRSTTDPRFTVMARLYYRFEYAHTDIKHYDRANASKTTISHKVVRAVTPWYHL